MSKISEYNSLDYDNISGEEYLILGDNPASPVTITATTISAASADNSFNDSGSGFGAYKVGKTITVSGFTDSLAELNGDHTIVSVTSSKIVVSTSITGDESAGNSVTIVEKDTNYKMRIDELPAGGGGSGTEVVQILVTDYTISLATGDGQAYFHIPASMNAMDLTTVHAEVITAGTTGTTDIQIHNVTAGVDMLSTKLTIDSTETGSDTAATPAVINTSNDNVSTNDLIRIDIDAVSTTKPKGLIVTMEFA